MEFINAINESTNPAIVFLLPVLFAMSGYAIGRVVARIRHATKSMAKDFLFGNLFLCLIFAGGFVAFGVLSYNAKGFFDIFSWAVIGSAIAGIYFAITDIAGGISRSWPQRMRDELPMLIGTGMIAAFVIYAGVIIYSHPIFEEYDSMYLYLPIAKSILLGNGLNHDFFTGSDIAIRSPPFTQSIDAWLINDFGYSTLRLFPIYFVFMSATAIYLLVKKVSQNPFLGLIGACVLLITPSLLVVSSRFSLQQDLSFLFFLTSASYLVAKIVSQPKVGRSFMVLTVALALMMLDREVGLIFSAAILFGVGAMKFTLSRPWLRAFLVVLAFSPLYALSAIDLQSVGTTAMVVIRLMVVVTANAAVTFVVSKSKFQQPISDLRPSLKYFLPLVVPAIFIAINFQMFSGPYPIIIFSGDHNQSLSLYRQVFGIPDSRDSNLISSLQTLPRIDVVIASLALGSIFLFFKIAGFAKLIRKARENPSYAWVLTLGIFLLVIWSYTLGSSFQGSNIRHLIYFMPVLSVAIALSMPAQEWYHKVYCLGVVVAAAAYVLFFNLHYSSYSGHFGGFWIDPYLGSFMSTVDYVVAAAAAVPLMLFMLKKNALANLATRITLKNRYLALSLALILCSQLYILTVGSVNAESPQITDQVAYNGWEQNIFEVIKYLQTAEKGNIIALRAPAISYFTNRTNFDMYSPQAFSALSGVLFEQNQTAFEQKLQSMDVRYVVIPNQKSSLYSSVQVLNNTTYLIQMVTSDKNFTRIQFHFYDVYKLGHVQQTDLLDKNHQWFAVNNAKITQSPGNLTISVVTGLKDKTYHRAAVQVAIQPHKSQQILSLNYTSLSNLGNASFVAELRDSNSKIVWSSTLENTFGQFKAMSFVLPTFTATKLEMRFYIISNGPGDHLLELSQVVITRN